MGDAPKPTNENHIINVTMMYIDVKLTVNLISYSVVNNLFDILLLSFTRNLSKIIHKG